MNNNPYYTSSQVQSREASLIQRVSYLLCTSLLVTAGAAWWAGTTGLSPALFFPLMIGTFVCVFAVSFTRRNPMLSLGLLYLLSVLEGLLMGPLLAMIMRGSTNGAIIVGEAAGLAGIIVAGLGTYVWISNKDFGGLGKFLFWGLIGLIVFGFIGFFVNMGAGASLLYALIGTALFVGFTLYDFSNIKHRFGPDDYVIATVQLYLDFLNLFWFLLQILMTLSGGGGGSRRSN